MKLKIALACSLLINAIIGLWLLVQAANNPQDRIGVLKTDVRVAAGLQSEPVLFTLPKGLTVRDASPRGLATMDLFEPRRFTLIVTSDDDLVDYSNPGKAAGLGEYYSGSTQQSHAKHP